MKKEKLIRYMQFDNRKKLNLLNEFLKEKIESEEYELCVKIKALMEDFEFIIDTDSKDEDKIVRAQVKYNVLVKMIAK